MIPSDRGIRLDWADMPNRVRREIERCLGEPAKTSISQPTGFSPGVAAVLTTTSGRRFFVKGVGPEPNPVTPEIHRREINVMTHMPNGVPVPRLLASYDEGPGGWVALMFEYIEGQHPAQPWRTDEIERVIAAIEDLNSALTPSPLPPEKIGKAGDKFVTSINGWRKIRDDSSSDITQLDIWSQRNIDALAAIEDTVGDALHGNTMLHVDIRADNILMTPDRVWFVDWPHASIGPKWLDVVAFAPSVTMQGGPPPDEVISRHSACRNADSDVMTAAVVALAGYFTRQAMRPPPPGLPTVRAFQDAQGIVARKWVARRTGLS